MKLKYEVWKSGFGGGGGVGNNIAFWEGGRLHFCSSSVHGLHCCTLCVSMNLMPFHTCIAHKLIHKHARKRSADKLQVHHGSSEI